MKNIRVLEEIKSRIDIVDFISHYVGLKKTGQNWKGLCPFHSEKTPSFTVNQAKQIFHCFGCGSGGDVITFLMKYENVSFHEAMAALAKDAGVTLAMGQADAKTMQRDEKIRNALLDACSYFAQRLQASKTALEYLKKRGISGESAGLFRLGYAPEGWHNLLKYLRSAGYEDPVIQAAGLAVNGEKGMYDMFRERLMFPIMSASGNILAFGGRAFADRSDSRNGSVPKYVNSPETAVFKKSDTLFGLYTAKEDIRRENRAIIVEGYMDVIVCYQYGFRNAVAPLGTSLTSRHVVRLRNFTNNSVLVFDGDAAGKSAAKRALPLICQNDYRAKVLLLPGNEDPDSYLRKYGSQAFNALIEKAKTMIDFLLSITTGEKIEVVRHALSLIAVIKDPLVADEMLTELSDRTRVHEVTIREEFRKIKNIASAKGPGNHKAALPAKNPEEYLLLSAVIAFPEKSDYVLSRIDIGAIRDKTLVSLFGKLASLEDKKNFANSILDSGEEEEKKIVTKFSVDPGFDPEHVDRNMEDCFRSIKKRQLDERLRLAEMSSDLALIKSLHLEKEKFIKEAGS
jgi:DNA primase